MKRIIIVMAEITEVEKVIKKEVNIPKCWQKLLITLGIIFICLTTVKISMKILTKYRI